MLPELTQEQLEWMSAEQRQFYDDHPVFMRASVGRQILEWNAEQRRRRQVERKRRLQEGSISRQVFEDLSTADRELPE